MLAAVVAFMALPFGRLTAQAVFDEEKAITYEKFKAQNNVDDSVLFIGTYIIHKDAMTDDLYEKAQDSASASGQDHVYYKSELADGSWFDTESIDNGVDGISQNGIMVPETELYPLYVTYYCGADGILKDAVTGLPVNAFDIPDPYDLKGLSELEPLWLQYTYSTSSQDVTQEDFLESRNSKDSGNLRTDVYYYQLLSTFFQLDLRDDDTNKLDQQLATLNDLYRECKLQEKQDEAEVVYKLMKKVDSARRAKVFEKLSELDVNALSTLFTLSTGSYYTSSGNFKDSSSETDASSEPDYVVELQDSLKYDFESSSSGSVSSFITNWLKRLGLNQSSEGWWTVLQKAEEEELKNSKKESDEEEEDEESEEATVSDKAFKTDSALTEAISTCISNCAQSYSTYSGDALKDMDTILGHAEYEYSSQVIESSAGALSGPVTYLKHIMNINEGIVADGTGELSLLEDSFLPLGKNKYEEAVHNGVCEEYLTAPGESAKSAALDEQQGEMDAICAELKFIIDAAKMRKDAAGMLEVLYATADWAEALKAGVPDDDFKTRANVSIESFLIYLQKTIQEVINSDENLKSALEKLKEKKEDLQKERDKCLDNNDLAGAKLLDAKIQAVDNDISDEEKRLSDILANGSASEQAAAAGALGNSLSGVSDNLVNKALTALADDANADISAIADALADLGQQDALNDLYDAAQDSGAGSDTLDGLKDAMSDDGAGGDDDGSGSDGDGKDSDGSESGGDGSDSESGGDGSDSESGAKSGLLSMTEEELLSALSDFFGGKSLDELDMKELAIATVAMSQVYRMGNNNAGELANRMATMGITANNLYFYSQYSGSKTVEYASLKTVSDITKYRYFYDDTKQTVTMTLGSTIYIFTTGSDQMYKGDTSTEPETMSKKLEFSAVPYLVEDACVTYFKCDTEYVSTSSYAVCYTNPMKAQIEEFISVLSGS